MVVRNFNAVTTGEASGPAPLPSPTPLKKIIFRYEKLLMNFLEAQQQVV